MKFILRPFYLKLLSILLITGLGIVVYSNSFFCSFHFDDDFFIVYNPAIRNIYNFQRIWGYWYSRFFTFLSFAFNYHLNGLNVFGYHLFNFLVHLVSAILVWWLTLLTISTPAMNDQLIGKEGNKITQHANLIALLAGLVFVSHPIQIEAVTNIWQRAASMAAMFYLASVCLYVKSRCMGGQAGVCMGVPTNRLYCILSLIIAIVAMFTKENAVTLPLIILFYERTFLNIKGRLDWKHISPFLFILIIIPLTLLLSGSETFQNHHGDLRIPGGVITPLHYFLTEFRVMLTYIRLVFLPINQNLDYDYPIYKNIFELPVLISFLFLITIFYFTKLSFFKYRLVSFFIFWFFLTLTIPESFFTMKDVIFEYRLYLPLVGYSIFLVGGAYYLIGKNNIKMMVIILSLLIACNSVLTYQRNKVWENDITLWNDVVQKSPYKARPYVNRGLAYAKQGNLFQAILDFNKGVRIEPNFIIAYYYRGLCYYKQGKLTQAISDFTKAIEMKPDYSQAYYSRGGCYDKQNNFPRATFDYSKAIEINPQYAEAYNNRAAIYGEHGKLIQAISDFTKAIEITPNNASIFLNRGVVYYQLKKFDRALKDVYKAEELGAVVNPKFISVIKQVSLVNRL